MRAPAARGGARRLPGVGPRADARAGPGAGLRACLLAGLAVGAALCAPARVALAAEDCPPGSAVLSSIERDEGKLDAGLLGEIVDGAAGADRRGCEIASLVGFVARRIDAAAPPAAATGSAGGSQGGSQGSATDGALPRDPCRLDPPARRQLTLALETLGRVRGSWPDAAPDAADPGGAAPRIGRLLGCIDADADALRDDASRRRLRRAAELALANARDGFLSTLNLYVGTCPEAEAKLRRTRALRRPAASEFAAKAAMIEVASRMTLAGLGCLDHESVFRDTVAGIREVRESGVLARSLEGWRWANDLLYAEAVALVALGRRDEAQDAVETLHADTPPAEATDLFAGQVHPVARALLERENRGRAEPYRDQIFVLTPVPGTGERARGRYVSSRDAAAALRALLAEDGAAPGPCVGACPDTLAALASRLRNALVRRDLSVVAGSFGTRAAAERGRAAVCSALGKGRCPFRLEPFRRYFRVAAGPMPEPEAVGIARALEDRKVETFLSRPRVLPPL